MTNNTKHPHAALIAEALLDLDREIQVYYSQCVGWMTVTIDAVYKDIEGYFKFRFADAEPKRCKIVSSLTDEQLINIAEKADWLNRLASVLREVANAAAQRAYEDIPMPHLNFVDNLLQEFGIAQFKDIQVMHIIARFIVELKEGKL